MALLKLVLDVVVVSDFLDSQSREDFEGDPVMGLPVFWFLCFLILMNLKLAVEFSQRVPVASIPSNTVSIMQFQF